ncbi:hypothetical protein EV421DRAFT_427507 [Armillaria borealis]|uniref:Uncharacterized protein n=1 Tax=Armillaria borealis TaxID=47425 RepID=A0AA39N246_9AGAR|nr:hypothetical protein EV421DRAFT_427507 [Armillaria borealis]
MRLKLMEVTFRGNARWMSSWRIASPSLRDIDDHHIAWFRFHPLHDHDFLTQNLVAPEGALYSFPIHLRHRRSLQSSPVRDGTQSTARRKYVVPDWARTDTAMQPRLSEDARRALKEAEDKKEAEREEKRQLERERRRTGRPQGRQPRENAENDAPTATTDVKSSSPLRPIAAVSTDFAMLTACETHSVSSLLTGSRSQTPPPSQDMAPPCTPPRRKSVDAPSTPFSSSLFTPLADSWKSPLVSPSTSPSYGAKGKHSSKDNDLSEELESAFEELNSLPPSSLPDSEAAPVTELEPVPSDTKQFWQGLPPSSPLQPSSPLEDVDDDSDREIPIATSDAEDGDGDEEDEDTDMESQPLSPTPKEAAPLLVTPPAPDENRGRCSFLAGSATQRGDGRVRHVH